MYGSLWPQAFAPPTLNAGVWSLPHTPSTPMHFKRTSYSESKNGCVFQLDCFHTVLRNNLAISKCTTLRALPFPFLSHAGNGSVFAKKPPVIPSCVSFCAGTQPALADLRASEGYLHLTASSSGSSCPVCLLPDRFRDPVWPSGGKVFSHHFLPFPPWRRPMAFTQDGFYMQLQKYEALGSDRNFWIFVCLLYSPLSWYQHLSLFNSVKYLTIINTSLRH